MSIPVCSFPLCEHEYYLNCVSTYPEQIKQQTSTYLWIYLVEDSWIARREPAGNLVTTRSFTYPSKLFVGLDGVHMDWSI
jgi:hypothetical protein